MPVIAYNKTMAERFGLPGAAERLDYGQLVEWGKAGTRDVRGYHWAIHGAHRLDAAAAPVRRQMASDDGRVALPDSRRSARALVAL